MTPSEKPRERCPRCGEHKGHRIPNVYDKTEYFICGGCGKYFGEIEPARALVFRVRGQIGQNIHDAQDVLRAIVEELGITEEVIEAISDGTWERAMVRVKAMDGVRALRCILDAAGVE